MINVSKTDIDIITDILKEHVPDKEVRVFGSRYRGTNKAHSDLDLAVVGEGKMTLLELGELQEAFEDSELTFRVDVVDYNDVSDEFRKIIDDGYEVVLTGWKKVRLGDVCVIKYGKDHKKLNEGTIPVFGSGGLMRYVDKALHEKKSVLIPRKGTLTNLFFVNYPFWTVDTLFWTDINELKVVPEYLYYFLKTQNLSSHNTGTAVPSLTTEILNEILISLPQIEEQKAIAETLSCLDDKIELNNQINKTLEETAQAIFKQWFIDFEFPNEDGEPYKSSGGEMVESKLGLIPKGWEVGKLQEVVKTIDNRGKTPPLENDLKLYPIIDVKALSGESRIINYNNCSKYVTKETYDNWFRSGHPKELDILISTVGSLASLKMFFGNKGCIAQNVVALRCSISPYYIYQFLLYYKNDLMAYDIGSVQPSIKVTHILKHAITQPSANILDKFNIILKNLSDYIYNQYIEIDTLTDLRNTLLPKLMTGEIRIPTKEQSNV